MVLIRSLGDDVASPMTFGPLENLCGHTASDATLSSTSLIEGHAPDVAFHLHLQVDEQAPVARLNTLALHPGVPAMWKCAHALGVFEGDGKLGEGRVGGQRLIEGIADVPLPAPWPGTRAMDGARGTSRARG